MQDKANPLATVLSAALLLKYGLGEGNAAKRIENAVLDALNRGFRTGDIYSAGNVCVFSLPLSFTFNFSIIRLVEEIVELKCLVNLLDFLKGKNQNFMRFYVFIFFPLLTFSSH